MKRIVSLIGLLALGTASAQAADLMIAAEVPATPAPASPGIYVQALGGGVLGVDADFYDSTLDDTFADAMDAGWAVAGTVGIVVMNGLSLEADVLHAQRDFADFDGGLSTTSLMANAKYTFPVGDAFSLYGAAGVGLIMGNSTFGGSDTDFSGFGYQLIGGVAAEVADNVSLVGEGRYQQSFSPLTNDLNADTLDIPTVTALVGLKFGF
jgi:opacity protein-like surface antigen